MSTRAPAVERETQEEREREERKAKEEAYRTLQEDRRLLVDALRASDLEGPLEVTDGGATLRIAPRKWGRLRRLGSSSPAGGSSSARIERLFLAWGPRTSRRTSISSC